MRRMKDDALSLPLDDFERALHEEFPGHERDWAENVRLTLTGILQALRDHTANAEGEDGLLSEVDLTRPSLVRGVSELQREHLDFVEEAAGLQADIENAVQAFKPADPGAPPTALPEPKPPMVTIPDFGTLRQRGEDLAAALHHHKDEEAKLMIESVTTDLGAGD